MKIIAIKKFVQYGLRFFLLIIILLFIISVSFLIYRKYRQSIINSRSAEIIENGGISEMREIELNGSRQYIVVETQDTGNPVVLFLHGGPGMATPFGASSRGIYPEISENVTAVYWDQRGAGKSYPNTNPDLMNIDQFTDDVLALSEMLIEEFNQDKIYIFAVSWGTVPGLKAVYERPELYHAYLSYAQMTNLVKSEEITYNWLLENASKEDIDILKEIGPPTYSNESDDDAYTAISDKTTGEGEVKADLLTFFSSIIYSPDYSLSDVYNTIRRGTSFSMGQTGLVDEIYALNFHEEIRQLEVPVYLFIGWHDRVVTLALTQDYYDLIFAPSKELIVLEQSGHIPSAEDFSRITVEIINKIYGETPQ